jgi:hypothetical protein
MSWKFLAQGSLAPSHCKSPEYFSQVNIVAMLVSLSAHPDTVDEVSTRIASDGSLKVRNGASHHSCICSFKFRVLLKGGHAQGHAQPIFCAGFHVPCIAEFYILSGSEINSSHALQHTVCIRSRGTLCQIVFPVNDC